MTGLFSVTRCTPAGCVCWMLLLSLLVMTPTRGEHVMLEIDEHNEQVRLALENEYLKVVLLPLQRAGMIEQLIYKPLELDLSASAYFPQGEGPATQRTNYGYLFRQTGDTSYQVLESTPEQAVVEVSYRWQDEHRGTDYDFVYKAVYTLKQHSSRLRVDWQVSNQHAEARSIAPWLKHTMQGQGRHLGMTEQGLTELVDNKNMPVAANWVARVESDPDAAGHTFFTVFEHEKVHETYHWRQQHRYTHEIIYNGPMLQPNESWQTHFYMGLTPNLPNVMYASPEGAVGMTPQQVDGPGQVDLHLHVAGTMDLGRVRLEGQLLRGQDEVMPLGPRYLDWSAGQSSTIHHSLSLSEPGVYTVRLNVYQEDGQQYALGRSVGAHAQVIEIPLVVGAARADQVVFAAWPKEPFVYPAIEGRDLELPVLGQAGSLSVATAHPTFRVFREDRLHTDAPRQAVIERSAARGEWESIPLMLFPGRGRPSQDVQVTVLPLKHTESDAVIDQTALYEISHVTTSQPSRLRNFPVGRYPDPLLVSSGRVNVSGEENLGLWVNVRVPFDAPAGIYEGIVQVRAGDDRLDVPVRLRVWDFQLPSPPSLRTWAGFVGFNLPRQMAFQGVEAYDGRAFRDSLIQWCVDYGFSPGHGSTYSVEELVRWDQHNRGISAFFGGGRYAQAWATQENVDRHGWTGRVYQYAPFDEHGDHMVPQVRQWAQDFRQANPHIKVLDVYYGNHTQPLHDVIDVWCRAIQRDDWTQERMAAGDEFWRVNAPLIWEVEVDILQGRQDYWQMYSHGYTGQLLWSIAPWGYAPPDYRGLGVNALAVVLYPTPTGPTTSIRWENMRDGLEDYDYLTVLARRMAEAEQGRQADADLLVQARAIVDDPDLHARITDPESLEDLRMRIATLIEALSSSPANAD